MKMPTDTFTYTDLPSPGMRIVMPHVAKAAYKAYYEHIRAGKPIKEFTYTYTYTEEDLAPYLSPEIAGT